MSDQSTKLLYIRNWHRYQHYKHRSPPWVKLHRDILRSRDWVEWSNASRLAAFCCLLVASTQTPAGSLPTDGRLVALLSNLRQKLNLQPLIKSGFLVEDASKMLAPRKHGVPPEEEYREREEDSESKIEKKLNGHPVSAYAFESGVIRLNQKDYDRWKSAFSFLQLDAELVALSGWAATQKSWFNAVSGALAKRNRAVAAGKRERKPFNWKDAL